MKDVLTYTDYNFHDQQSVYRGKVRDVYNVGNDLLIMVATDRISAFDVVLPKGIPYKGEVLNRLASRFLDDTKNVCPNWKLAQPDPQAMVGVRCETLPVEMIVRGYLCGSAWRAYKSGVRKICDVQLPEGLHENEPFPQPIITPTTKAQQGEHDQDISRDEILRQGLVSEADYSQIEKYTIDLFQKGTEIALKQGLILVDTKYEFGKKNGQIFLIDEIHTPDSSRYFYRDGYPHRLANNLPQRQLSKEFVREWLMENGFQGRAGEVVPTMTDAVVQQISDRYVELFERITGEKFTGSDMDNPHERIKKNVDAYLATLV